MHNYFCGWYYKCQSKEQTLALIPALHISEGRRSCSLQLISNEGNWNISLSAADSEIQPNKPVSVFENAAYHARYQLSKKGKTILEFETVVASFEFEYP